MTAFTIVKLGGRSIESPAGRAQLAARLAALRTAGRALVVVHGGGVQVTGALAAAGIEARFVNGLRVTDEKVLEVAEPIFAHIGKTLADALTRAGAPALALTGRDAHVLRATVKDPALGRVGTVTSADAVLLRAFTAHGLTPVLGPIAVDGAGPLNVNADEVAGATARSLAAAELLLLTDVPAVLGADARPIASLTRADAEALIKEGVVRGGMIPKVQGALDALASGVARVRVIDEAGLDALALGNEAGTVFVHDR